MTCPQQITCFFQKTNFRHLIANKKLGKVIKFGMHRRGRKKVSANLKMRRAKMTRPPPPPPPALIGLNDKYKICSRNVIVNFTRKNPPHRHIFFFWKKRQELSIGFPLIELLGENVHAL